MSDGKELPASAKRRGELREKGQVVKSQDIVSTALLSSGLLGLLLFGPPMGNAIIRVMSVSFQEMGHNPIYQNPTVPFNFISATDLLPTLGFFLASIMTAAAVSQIAQVGFLLTDTPLEPSFEKLNPINGLKNIFSLRKGISSLLSIVKIGIIGLFAYASFQELLASDVFTRPVNAPEQAAFLLKVVWAIGWRITIGLGIIATIDYLYQRWQFEDDNKMSLEELKDEMKQFEGSPEVKAKRRALQRKRSMRRMLEDVADATIVITNPTHYAVALRYVRGETPIPIILAKGQRRNALMLKERAATCGVPMTENVPLAQGLFRHGVVGDPIPMLYYQGVANVLAQLYRRGFRSGSETQNPEEN